MDLKIYNGRSYFYQWDSNQKFIVEDDHVNELHFTNDSQEDASVIFCYESEGVKYCDVPNSYLEKNGILTVYAFTYENGNYTKNTFRFNVIERPKPNDYVIEEEDINRWGELDNKINVTKDELENEIEDITPLYVNITNKNGVYSADKTYDEVVACFKAGKPCYFAQGGSSLNLVDYCQGGNGEIGYIELSKISDKDGYITVMQEVRLVIKKDNTVVRTAKFLDMDRKADAEHKHDDKYYPKEVIDEKLSKVDANVSEEDIANAVEDYLAENPIEIPSEYVTEDEIAPFEVNFDKTYNYDTQQYDCTCNKTRSEITKAINEKRRIIATYSRDSYLQLAYWSSLLAFYEVSQNCIEYYKIDINDNVTYTRINLQETSSTLLETKSKEIVEAINEVKEDLDETKTKLDKVDSKQSLIPWEHILDKPLYDTRTTELTFDGNVNDPRVWMGLAVCLTDYVPTNSSELVGAKVTIAFFDNANYTYDVTITSSMIRESNDGFKVNTPFKRPSGSDYSIDAIEVIKEDLYYDGVLLIKKGIYGYCREDYGFYVSKFSMNGKEFGELKKLDEKYLPNMVSSWNDLEDKPFYEETTTIIEHHYYICNAEDMGVQVIAFPNAQQMGNGKLCVSWNQTIYKYPKLTKFKYDDITTWYMFGNIGALNDAFGTSYEVTNEPFIGAYVVFEGRELPNIVFIPLDGSLSAWIKMWEEDSKTLDTKYLPQSLRFGEVTSNTITFDGIKDFKEYIYYGNDIYYVKVSDYIPTKEEVLGTVGYFVDTYGELLASATTTEDMIQDVAPFGFASMMTYNGTPLPVVIVNNNDASGYSQGVYFILFEGMGYVSKVEFKNNISNVITPIDSKFIPTFGNVKNYLIPQDTKTLVFDEEGNLAISELPSLDVIDATKPIFIDLNGTIYESDLMEVEFGTYLFGNVDLWFEIGDNEMPFLGIIEDDGETTQIALLLIYETESVSVSVWQNKDNNLLIASPNGKVFKLVVDDNGNLSTEAI